MKLKERKENIPVDTIEYVSKINYMFCFEDYDYGEIVSRLKQQLSNNPYFSVKNYIFWGFTQKIFSVKTKSKKVIILPMIYIDYFHKWLLENIEIKCTGLRDQLKDFYANA